MKIVHVQTSIQTVFGYLDEDDVVRKQPVSLELGKLCEKEILDALSKLTEIKKQLEENGTAKL